MIDVLQQEGRSLLATLLYTASGAPLPPRLAFVSCVLWPLEEIDSFVLVAVGSYTSQVLYVRVAPHGMASEEKLSQLAHVARTQK